jgi:phospholipid/cholesterol/gamma-HCH transport system substrate-binding protein
MATRSEKVKLGIFLTVTGFLLAGALAVLTGSEVWEERSSYVIRFAESVSGLESGAPVKQRGVRVGYVDSIRVSPESVEQVEVQVKVQPNTPIKTDTKAYMNMQGITGLKFIELKEGSRSAERLEPGEEIPAGTSTLQELTGRASKIGIKFEKLLNNMLTLTRPENREKFDSVLEKTDETVTEFNASAKEIKKLAKSTRRFIETNRKPLEAALASVVETSNRATATLDHVDELVGDLNQIARDAEVPEAVSEVRETNELVKSRIENMDADKAVDNVTVALKRLQHLLEQMSETIGQNKDSLRVTIQNLRSVSETLKNMSRTFQEKPFIQIFGNQPKERDLP